MLLILRLFRRENDVWGLIGDFYGNMFGCRRGRFIRYYFRIRIRDFYWACHPDLYNGHFEFFGAFAVESSYQYPAFLNDITKQILKIFLLERYAAHNGFP